MKKTVLFFLSALFLTGFLSAESRSITVTNDLNETVYYLYLSPEEDSDWGEDRLGDEILDPGSSITIDVQVDSASAVFDLMAEDESEKSYRIEGLNLQEISSISITADDFLPFGGRNPVLRTLTFYNEADEDIYYLYVSSNDSMYWGEDILGDEILYGGSSYTIELPIDEDYPLNDILAEGETGSSYELMSLNLIETDEIIITEENMTMSGDDYYEDEYYDDYDETYVDEDGYLEGYREGFRDGWKEAYRQGYLDAMNEMGGE